MAAPMKMKTDARKSLQNAVCGLSRYTQEGRMEKLHEALAYLRKKIASDDQHAEIFRDLSGISVLLHSVRKLATKCTAGDQKNSCKFHGKVSKRIDARLSSSGVALDNVHAGAESEEKSDAELSNSEVMTSGPAVLSSVTDSVPDEREEKCGASKSNEKMLEIAVSILANCCYMDTPSQKKLSSLLGIPLLVIIFQEFDEEPLQNRVCRCLANMCSTPAILEQILSENFPEVLVPRLHRTENEDCQRTYIRALRLLGSSKSGLAHVTRHRGVVAVAARIGSANQEVRKAAVRAVMDLASGQRFDADAYEQVVVSRCITHVVPWLASEDSCLRHDAQSLVYKLLVSDQIRAEFGNAGGIDFLYKQLSDAETRKTALLHSLLWCTRESVNRMKIRECGALDLLVEFLSFEEFSERRPDIIAGLCNFIYDDVSMQKLIDKKVVPMILDILLTVNEIPKLDVLKLAKKVADTFGLEDEKAASHGTRYSMDSPSYQHNEWEWNDFGELLCKTSFEPIWNSPARCESPSSGGMSPRSSTSYWSPASPSFSSPPQSPRRSPSPPLSSPSPPPSPPSPLLPEPDSPEPHSDDESEPADKTESVSESVPEPPKSQRSANHILALLLRFCEMDHVTFFKENSACLTTCLFSYATLTDEPSKTVWILVSRLMSEADLFTEILESNWIFILSMLFISDSDECVESRIAAALGLSCCVQGCEREVCDISQHAGAPGPHAGRKEARRLVEGFLALCQSYYGRGTLAQILSAAVRGGDRAAGSASDRAGDERLVIVNVALLCRAVFRGPELRRPVLQQLMTCGGVKSLVDAVFFSPRPPETPQAPKPPTYLHLSLLHLAHSLTTDFNRLNHLQNDSEIGLDNPPTTTNSRKRKPSESNSETLAASAKRQRKSDRSHSNDRAAVTSSCHSNHGMSSDVSNHDDAGCTDSDATAPTNCCHSNLDDAASCHGNSVGSDDYEVRFTLDDGSVVRARSSVLCDASQVFHAMLRGHFKESSQNEIRLKAISKPHLNYILHSLNCNIDSPSVIEDIGFTDMIELLRICDQYLLETIKTNLILKLTNIVRIDNVIPILGTALLLHETELLISCLEAIFRSEDVSEKVSVLKKLTELSLDSREILSESVVKILVEAIKAIPTGRTKL